MKSFLRTKRYRISMGEIKMHQIYTFNYIDIEVSYDSVIFIDFCIIAFISV